MSSQSKFLCVSVALVGFLALAGCAPSDKPTASSSAPAPSATASVDPDPIYSTDVFGAPAWSVTAAAAPVVVGGHVVWLDGETVVAVDDAGQMAWTVNVEHVEGPRAPSLRLADPGTLALVQAGLASGGGLSTSGQVIRVTLVDIATGEVVKQVDVPNPDEVLTVDSSLQGLVFTGGITPSTPGVVVGGDVRSVVVSPAGEMREVSTAAEGHYPIAAIGEHVVWMNATLYPDSINTDSMALDLPVQGQVVFSDYASIVGVSDGAGVSWVDLDAGSVFAETPCGPKIPSSPLMTGSTDGGFVVAGDALLNVEAKTVTCLTAGEGAVAPSMAAVTDDGSTFGVTPVESRDVLAVGQADGGVEAHDLSERQSRALIVGAVSDLVVHYDPQTGTVTANPVSAGTE